MGEKEECLTYTTGAVEVRQTAHEMTIINHGSEPVKVRLLAQCTNHLDWDALDDLPQQLSSKRSDAE